jgi:predicted acylesterase/phospholipase RssA
MATRRRRPVGLSFSGSGHLLVYQLGAACHLLIDNDRWRSRITHFAGSSGGAIAATLSSLLPRERLATFARDVAIHGHSFTELSQALAGHGDYAISETTIASVSRAQTLFLSATHCRTGQNALFSRFSSAVELQRCVLASAAIPSAFHPMDLLARANPRYPEASGIIVSPACEADGGIARRAAARRDSASEEEGGGLGLGLGRVPFSPHGEAYVDGGITNTAPLLCDVVSGCHTLTVSPVSGPRGCLQPASAEGSPAHLHVAPHDASLRWPWGAPRLAGMQCYLSVDNVRALRVAMGAAGPRTLSRWFDHGMRDAERFSSEFDPPD